jgi:hypothetical protein
VNRFEQAVQLGGGDRGDGFRSRPLDHHDFPVGGNGIEASSEGFRASADEVRRAIAGFG